MKKRILIASILLSLLVLTNFATSNKISAILIDRIIGHFKQLSTSGKTDVKIITDLLNDCMKQARKFKMDNKIDRSFFDRYQRLLAVIKLLMVDDTQRILTPLLSREIGEFPGARNTQTSISKPGSETIATVAAYLSEELVALKLYLVKNKPVKLNLFPKDKITPFIQLKNKNTLYFKKSERFPFTGIAVKKNADGQISEKISFEKGRMAGKRIQYTLNGLKRAEGMMKNNVKSGIWIFFNDDGEVKEIVNCNYPLRHNYRLYQLELNRGNAEKAAFFLQKAIQIKPIRGLLTLKNELPLHQSMACARMEKFDKAIRFAIRWVKIQAKLRKKRNESEAWYRLGVIYWQQLYKQGKILPRDQKFKLILNGLAAIKRAILLDPYSPFPHAYKSLLYRERGNLDPENKQKYQKMADEARKKMSMVLKESRNRLPMDYNDKGTASFVTITKKKAGGSPYKIKEDFMQEKLLFLSPPPPPPPPPPKRK